MLIPHSVIVYDNISAAYLTTNPFRLQVTKYIEFDICLCGILLLIVNWKFDMSPHVTRLLIL